MHVLESLLQLEMREPLTIKKFVHIIFFAPVCVISFYLILAPSTIAGGGNSSLQIVSGGAPSTAITSPIAYYVSAAGDDTSPGTESQPFRTLAKARDVVRTINGHMTRDITVFVREGEYQLPATLTFDHKDSGTNGFNVIYKAYPGEKPLITGGQTITGWTVAGKDILKASVGSLRFRQLYVNGTRAIRARTPNKGSYYRIKSWDTTNRRIGINRNEITDWQRLNDVEMVHQKIMALNFMRIASFTISGRYAYVIAAEPERTRTFSYQLYPHGASGQAYHFENAYEFLDMPGEWYLNIQTNELFYKVRPGEDISTMVVVAPRLETLLKIRGTLDAPVHHIQFCGLMFEHSTWLLPSREGYISDGGSGLVLTEPLPSDQLTSYPGVRPPAGVYLEAAHHIRFERNIFSHMGAGGILLYVGTHDNVLAGNVFIDISGNGIAVDMNLEGNPSDRRKISKRDSIENNYMYNIAQDAGVVIHAGYPEAMKIEHNEIANSPYMGILLGWGWSLNNNVAGDNLIRYNKVYDVMNLLADGGGIYTLSKQPGTYIAENHVHDIVRSAWASSSPVAGIFLDQGSDLITVENNVLQNVDQKIYLNTGSNTSVGSRNIFINNDGLSHMVIDNAGLEPEYRDIKTAAKRPDSRRLGSFHGMKKLILSVFLSLLGLLAYYGYVSFHHRPTT